MIAGKRIVSQSQKQYLKEPRARAEWFDFEENDVELHQVQVPPTRTYLMWPETREGGREGERYSSRDWTAVNMARRRSERVRNGYVSVSRRPVPTSRCNYESSVFRPEAP